MGRGESGWEWIKSPEKAVGEWRKRAGKGQCRWGTEKSCGEWRKFFWGRKKVGEECRKPMGNKGNVW